MPPVLYRVLKSKKCKLILSELRPFFILNSPQLGYSKFCETVMDYLQCATISRDFFKLVLMNMPRFNEFSKYPYPEWLVQVYMQKSQNATILHTVLYPL